MDLNLFVTYFVAQQTNGQQGAIDEFLSNQHKPGKVIATFVEESENARNNKWYALQEAIKYCKENQATLLIAELGTLTNKESFVNGLLHCNVNFCCVDQPFVDLKILEALYKHSRIQKQVHVRLIKAGLEKTSAKSGNPHAAEVISQVNKPKIDAAIVFAFLLHPIISHYKQKGFSQRQMVKSLNEEGFTAPEGGKWVLSQLQKVLDRVNLNEVVLQLQDMITSLLTQQKTNQEIAEELNAQNIPGLKKSSWDENQVTKVLFRLEQIQEIEYINKFTISLLPILHEFKQRNYTTEQMVKYFDKHEIAVNI